MFKIVDGREYFYQWDLDRQIEVADPTITEVHFCNRTDECSLVVAVTDGIANVPNIILQKSFDVRVFGYDGKATRFDEVFKVKPRTQPADYIYTETETLQWGTINERMNTLEEEIPGRVELYVQEALTNNPELLDTVTIDVSACKEGGAVRLTMTDDLKRFIQSTTTGKDVLAFLKDVNMIFSATTTIRDTGSQYLIHLHGTPYFTNGNETGTNFRYTVQIVVNKDTGYTSAYGYKHAITEFATEEYVNNAIANIEIPGGGSGGSVDLSDYYTKEETDELISKIDECDTYFFNPYAIEWQTGLTPTPAPEELIEFNRRLRAGDSINLCIAHQFTEGVTTWVPAVFTLTEDDKIVLYRTFTQADIGQQTSIQAYQVYTHTSSGILQVRKGTSYSSYIADKKYVDTAIQNALNGIATAEGGAY
jgi:hypothetical protein